MLSQVKSFIPTEPNWQRSYRDIFPIFQRNRAAIYLDSAATAQKPHSVLETEREYLETSCANSGRGSYNWAFQTSQLVARTRTTVANFIDSRGADEVAFTSGATMSLNLVALGWGEGNLKDGDEILYCPSDHKSLNAPWFQLQKRLARRNVKIELKPYPLLPSGAVDVDSLLASVSPRTRLLNLTHIHNVAGIINDVSRIRSALPNNVLINLDCAQSISHLPVSVKNLNVDFMSFSGHKAYSSPGIGVLWVRKELHSLLSPVFVGGGQPPSFEESPLSLADLFESGTLNILGIVSLGAAIDFMDNIGRETIHRHTADLTRYLHLSLLGLSEPRVELVYPGDTLPKDRCGLVSFNLDGYSSVDVGDYLSSCNIFVRQGTHCAGMNTTTLPTDADSIRVSFGIYNKAEDVDRLVQVLRSISTL